MTNGSILGACCGPRRPVLGAQHALWLLQSVTLLKGRKGVLIRSSGSPISYPIPGLHPAWTFHPNSWCRSEQTHWGNRGFKDMGKSLPTLKRCLRLEIPPPPTGSRSHPTGGEVSSTILRMSNQE